MDWYTAGMRLVGNTHLVAGGTEAIPRVLALLKQEGFETEGNPDVYVRTYQRFGVDEARELRERASLRAVGTRRIFVIATSGMTHEAQNALLKTLEEPPADAMFLFIVPSPQMLLSTLRSRTQILEIGTSDVQKKDIGCPFVDAKAFLAAPAQKRLDMLKPLLEKDEDDKRDIGAVVEFLSSVERALASEAANVGMAAVRGEGLEAARREGLESVYRARKYIGDKGALVKPLLEQVALLVPMV